jgi:hypothetical protein
MGKDRTGEFIFDLYKDGIYYAQRSMNCGFKTAADAVKQWQRKGFTVKTIQQPKKN